MKPSRNPFTTAKGVRLAVAAFGIVLSAPSAHADVSTWVGNTSADLSGLNWTGTNNPPISLDSWIFGTAGTAGATLNNGLAANLSVAGITFNNTASAYTISGNAITLTGNITDNFVGTETLNFNIATTAVRTVTTATGSTLVLGGNVTGTGGLTTAGTGSVTLAGTNTYSGLTTLSGGTLNLDFSAATAPVSNIIAAGTTVTSGNLSSLNLIGTAGNSPLMLNLTGNASTANTQAFAGVTASVGMAHLNLTPGASGGSLAVQLGNIRTSATTLGGLDISLPTGATATTVATNSNGMIANVTVNGNTFATSAATTLSGVSTITGTNLVTVASGAPSNGTQIQFTTIPTGSGLAAGATYYVIGSNGSTQFQLGRTPTGSAIALSTSTVAGTGAVEGALTGLTSYASTFAANNNLDVTTNVTAGANSLANSVRFNTAAVTTLTLNGVNQVKSGGILVTSAVGANLSKITGGVGIGGTDRRGITIFQNNTLGELEIASVITDRNGANTTTFNKNGMGTLLLTATNSYSGGGSNINEGKVIVTADPIAAVTLTGANTSGSNQITGLADTSGIFVGEAVTGASFTTANVSWIVTAKTASSVTVSSNSNVAGGTSFNFLGGGALGYGGVVSIAPGASLQIGNGGTTGSLVAGQTVTNNGAVIFNRSNDQSFSNIVSGTGTLEKQGAAILTLSGANTYSGATAVTAGTLQIGGVGSLGGGTYAGSIALNNASSLKYSSSATQTLSGIISGNGTLTKDTSASILTLTNANNTFTGAINITAGTLTASNATAQGSGAFTVLGGASAINLNDGATLVLAQNSSGGFGRTYTVASPLTVSGNATVNASYAAGNSSPKYTFSSLSLEDGSLLNVIDSGNVSGRLGATTTFLKGSATISDQAGSTGGRIELSNVTADHSVSTGSTSTLTVAGGSLSGAINGAITNNAVDPTKVLALVKGGTGNLTLTATNTFTGATTLTSGSLILKNTNALQNSTLAHSGAGILAFDSTVFAFTLGGLSGSSNIALMNNAAIPAAIALTVGKNNSSNSYSGALSGDGSLTKNGSGILTLSGANTFTGATLISAGTLALDASGTINNTNEVSLGTVGTFDVSAKGLGGYSVATLKGSGNVTGALTVSTTLAIGNSSGTTNFNNDLTLDSATYVYEMTGGASPGLGSADLGMVADALTISAGSILDLVELGTYTAGNKFTLFGYGTLSGTFDGLANNATFFDDLANTWRIQYDDTSAGANGGTGTNFVTITAVPEPNVAPLLGGLGTLALLRRRR